MPEKSRKRQHSQRRGLLRLGDVLIGNPANSTLTGRIVSLRRLSSGQRAEIRLHGSGELVEAEIQPGVAASVGNEIGVNLGHVRIFRESA